MQQGHVQQGHTAWTCSINAEWTCSKNMQHGQVAYTWGMYCICSVDMWTCDMDMQHENDPWTWSREIQHGHAAKTFSPRIC
jgi:hypothetical protein